MKLCDLENKAPVDIFPITCEILDSSSAWGQERKRRGETERIWKEEEKGDQVREERKGWKGEGGRNIENHFTEFLLLPRLQKNSPRLNLHLWGSQWGPFKIDIFKIYHFQGYNRTQDNLGTLQTYKWVWWKKIRKSSLLPTHLTTCNTNSKGRNPKVRRTQN